MTVLGLLILRLLTPPMAAIITGDSVGYLARSQHPLSFGFVVNGYRQAAYPLWIHFVGWIDWIFGFDNIFAVAFTQRMLLIVGVVLAWGALRWWALPLLLVVTSATYVLQTDYVLMEGYLGPVALIAGALAASVSTGQGVGARRPRAAFVVVSALAVSMGAMKLQYSNALLLAAAIAWLVWRDGALTIKYALVTLALSGFTLTGIAVAQTVENHRELGTWEPVGERARAEWYGAYEAVFIVHPENQTKPELAEFYADGDLYEFMHGLEETEPNYTVRQAALRKRVADMFAAAGMTKTRQEIDAFFGGIRGGRTDDIGPPTDAVNEGGPKAFEDRIKALRKRPGPRRTLDALAGEEPTGVATVQPVTGRLQEWYDDYRPGRGSIGIVALILGLVALVVPGRHRPIIIASTLTLLAVCAVLATGYIDNARYLVAPMTMQWFGATLGAKALAEFALRLRRASARPGADLT
jgi:hypothetical protein